MLYTVDLISVSGGPSSRDCVGSRILSAVDLINVSGGRHHVTVCVAVPASVAESRATDHGHQTA